jgi:anti-sigma B factor antagonist
MRFKDKIKGDVGIVTLKGNLMGMPETEDLQSEVKAMLGQKIKKVVLDLSGVSWINSIGIGSIMRAHTTMVSAEGKLCLANVSDKVNSVLIITQLQKIFNTYNSVDEAIKSLN